MVEVYQPGANVLIGSVDDDPILAKIIKVCIEEHEITYCVVWWDGRTRNTEWLYEFEFTSNDADKVKCGF